MKIAIINMVCGFGSTGKNTIGMYNDIINQGHCAKVFYGAQRIKGNKNPDFIFFGNKLSFFVDHVLSALFGLSGALEIIPTHKLFKELDAFSPDVLWLCNLHGGYVNEYRLLNYAKKKAKWTLYSMVDEYPFLGKCCYAYDCDKYKEQGGCHHCKHLKDSPRSLFFDNSHFHFKRKQRAYSDFHNITFISAPYVVEKAKESILLHDKEFITTDTTVDIKGMYYPRDVQKLRSKLGIPEQNKVMILCASCKNPYKGTQYYLELAKRCEHDNISFIHVGFNGNINDCPPNYIVLQYVDDQNELAELLSLADAYVCTSIADAQPNACLNALGCGTPIIGFNVSGVPYVATSEYGTFVSPFNIEELVNAVRSFPKKTAIMAERCHQYALERFGGKSIVNPEESLLSIIERRIT